MNAEPRPAEEAIPVQRSRWVTGARVFALGVFAVFTALGVYALATGDWREVAGFWISRRRLLLAAFLLSCCDISMDGVIWLGVLRRLGVRLPWARGLLVYYTGYAGHLMPAQLGRLFRATELVRYRGCSMTVATSSEVILLFFVTVTSMAVFCGAWLTSHSFVLGMCAAVALIVLALLTTTVVFPKIPVLSRHVPPRFWGHPMTWLLCALASTGWLINGLILYLVFKDVTAALHLYQTTMIVTSNLFVGVSSGLPGGLGLSDGYIGAMMYWLETPPEHLVVAVAAFRVITFWMWIPLGWCAVAVNAALSRLFAVGKDEQ